MNDEPNKPSEPKAEKSGNPQSKPAGIDKAGENSSEAGQAEKKETPFSAKLWAEELKACGWKEATDGVTAIELPGSAASPKPHASQTSEPKPPNPQPDRNSPEAIRERLGAALFLETLLEEETNNFERGSAESGESIPKEKPQR